MCSEVPVPCSGQVEHYKLHALMPSHLQFITGARDPDLLLQYLQAPVPFIILLEFGISRLSLYPWRKSCTKLKLRSTADTQQSYSSTHSGSYTRQRNMR